MFIHEVEWLPVQLMVRVASFCLGGGSHVSKFRAPANHFQAGRPYAGTAAET